MAHPFYLFNFLEGGEGHIGNMAWTSGDMAGTHMGTRRARFVILFKFSSGKHAIIVNI